MVADTNSIILTYLLTDTALVALVSDRIYCPRLPEKATLPAIGFFTRGGDSNPYIPGIVTPSVQFDCWATDTEVAGVVTKGSIIAREVYRALYDALQGIQGQIISYPFPLVFPIIFSHRILSAIEEVQGQDLVDVKVPDYFRVLTFFRIMIRAE